MWSDRERSLRRSTDYEYSHGTDSDARDGHGKRVRCDDVQVMRKLDKARGHAMDAEVVTAGNAKR